MPSVSATIVGPEAGRADDRVEHEVGAGLRDEPDEALGPGEHLAAGPRLGRARGGVGVRQRDPAHAVGARLLDERLVRGAGGQPDELELARGALDDVERLRADGARRAEDEQPLHGEPIVAGVSSAADKPCGASCPPAGRRSRARCG